MGKENENPSYTELSRKRLRFFIQKGIFDFTIIPHLLVDERKGVFSRQVPRYSFHGGRTLCTSVPPNCKCDRLATRLPFVAETNRERTAAFLVACRALRRGCRHRRTRVAREACGCWCASALRTFGEWTNAWCCKILWNVPRFISIIVSQDYSYVTHSSQKRPLNLTR